MAPGQRPRTRGGPGWRSPAPPASSRRFGRSEHRSCEGRRQQVKSSMSSTSCTRLLDVSAHVLRSLVGESGKVARTVGARCWASISHPSHVLRFVSGDAGDRPRESEGALEEELLEPIQVFVGDVTEHVMCGFLVTRRSRVWLCHHECARLPGGTPVGLVYVRGRLSILGSVAPAASYTGAAQEVPGRRPRSGSPSGTEFDLDSTRKRP
jgi:hypothetical protein